MESLQNHTQGSPSSKPSLFSPFVVNTLEVQGGFGFDFECACYNAKFNLIIACPGNETIKFYDATTFEPCEKRDVRKLEGSVTQIAFQPENDTYILGTNKGWIYKYKLPNCLHKLKNVGGPVRGIAFISLTFYAFSLEKSNKFYIGNLDDENVVSFDLNFHRSISLHPFTKRNLLFFGLDNGSVMIYRTNKLPHLKVFGSVQAHQPGKWVLSIQNSSINEKECLITASEDQTVKIWHLIRGKMRLLRVILFSEKPISLVYLENYKMIVIAYVATCIQFFRFPSMKLAETVDLSDVGRLLFLMTDKNMIGAINESGEIEFIQLQ